MTGRGVDQIMKHPSSPELYESYVKDARRYVKLAERASGPIKSEVPPEYIWGDALIYMKKADVRIINLETSITTSDTPLDKGINYRMHPKNIDCLKVAQINCCCLANNHLLDWGYKGLSETISTLKKAEIGYAGAGLNAEEAQTPAILNVAGKGRILVFSCGFPSSGIPLNWQATADKAGIFLVEDLTDRSLAMVNQLISKWKRPGDIVVLSIHWGPNWSYVIPEVRRKFAQSLIDGGNVDVIHGHSSHHIIGLEVYRNKLILYGCGDLLNDYEGISGHEQFKPRLGALYFAQVNMNNGQLASLQLVPTEMRKFRLVEAPRSNVRWLKNTVNRESKPYNTQLDELSKSVLTARWR